MKIRVGYDISYDCAQPVPMIVMLNIHYSRAADVIKPDHMRTDPYVPLRFYRDSFGNWCTRLVAPPGRIRLTTDEIVHDSGLPEPAFPFAIQHPIEDLPNDALLFLLGSRYCETDRLSPAAWSMFGHVEGWARVQAICDFVHQHVSFGYHHARPNRTAWETFNERVGVCRDFAHLALTLCRCTNIPARYCTGYLGDIGVPADPNQMDFSGWFEVYLDNQWHVFDARHNARRIGRILIAYGRDAADVAISNTFGPNRLAGFRVWTDQVTSDGSTDAVPSTETIYASSNGDRWELIQDTVNSRAFVRHKANESSGGHETDVSIDDFMRRNGSGPEHAALRHLISTRASAG
ncbi:MAG: transglutaminase family protein [Acetobacteraceae bacterium]|nr:transglutaminase family protein [Acetobacteraceae bacterium]